MFVVFGVCILYAMLRNATGARLIPLCGAILYVVFFVIGNDELEKQHIPAGILCGLAMLWTTIGLLNERENPWPWMIALWATVVTTILITIELGFLLSIYFTGFAAWYAWRRNWRRALELFSGAAIAVTGVATICVLNYAYTGLALEHFLLDEWRYTDLNRIRDWGILYEVIMLHAGFTGASLANGAFSLAGILSGKAIAWSDVLNFANFFRLSIWWPLVIPVILFLPWRLRNGTARQLMSAPCLARSSYYHCFRFAS